MERSVHVGLLVGLFTLVCSLGFGKTLPTVERATPINLTAVTWQPFAVDLTEKTKLAGNYSIVTGPQWLAINQKGILFGKPTTSELGTHRLFVSVVANGAEQLLVVYVKVVDEQAEPTLTFTTKVDEIFKVDLVKEIAAIEGEKLEGKFSISEAPAWLQVTPEGILIGIPEAKDAGSTSFHVSLLANGKEYKYLVILIVKGEVEPIPGPKPFEAKVGEPFSINVIQTVGLPGYYYVMQAPAWLNFNSKGTMFGVPKAEHVGTYQVIIHVTEVQNPHINPVKVSFNIRVQ